MRRTKEEGIGRKWRGGEGTYRRGGGEKVGNGRKKREKIERRWKGKGERRKVKEESGEEERKR